MRSTAFGKITAVYGQIDENGLFVRKWPARKIPITDKMVKNSCLSVNLSEILAHRPEQEKIRANHGTNFKCYSVAYGVMSVRLHTLPNQVSPHNPLVPSTLARARRAYPSQARLGYAGAERSASHLVLIRLRPATRLMISSCRVATALTLITRAPPYLPPC